MIGSTLGPFLVLEQIGAGGMGVVYEAEDQTLDRVVALKVLPPGALADETARKRFRTEALALSRLNHPNICTIYQVGEAESGGATGQTYIAMELVEGRPLDQVIRDAPVSFGAILRYGSQIADALAHAHERGITHRDMKSANVMISPEGRAKILDFGLAARPVGAGSDDAQLTEVGDVMGTPAYLAPEVIGGARADSRSDIWGLGIVLYEMATGARPFTAAGPALTYEILQRQPEFPESVPPALRSIIVRCLAKEPGERYQSAREVCAALEAIDSHARIGSPVGASPPWRPMSATRWALGAALVVAAAVLGYLFVGAPGPLLPGADAAPIRSLAVLPFTSFSGDREQEYFVDGMTEALIGELAKLGTLNVIARTSVMAYTEPGKTIQQIASELGVDGIVEGSAVSAGGRVRLSARLIDASSNDNLWADEYERDLSDILSLQKEMARTIGGRIQAALTPEAEARLADPGPVDLDAYELVLRGRFAAHEFSREGLESSIEYFDEAIARDPRYAPAYAGKAFAYANLSSIYVAPLVTMPLAKDAARRAIELDPQLAEPTRGSALPISSSTGIGTRPSGSSSPPST